MCGPTPEQTQLEGMQIQAYQQALDLTNKQYGNQQAIYAPMAKQFQSILDRGPGQKGFSDQEEDNLLATSTEGTAQSYSQAAKSVNESLAAEGGGANPLTSGAQAQLKSEVAQSGAQEASRERSQIETADYSQGYNEWLQSAEGLQAIASGQNPLGYESAATGSGSAASSTATSIAQEENSWVNAAIGAAGSIASNSKFVAG